jgi:class 3 adenylate cyclase
MPPDRTEWSWSTPSSPESLPASAASSKLRPMSAEAAPNHQIDRRWARFADAGTEARYLTAMDGEDRRTWTLAGVVALIATVLKSAVHGSVYPEAWAMNVGVHVGAAVGLVAVAMAARLGASRGLIERTGSVVVVGIAAAFVALDAEVGALDLQFAAVTGLLAAILAWTPMTFAAATTTCLAAVAVHMAIIQRVEFAEGAYPIAVQLIFLILLLLLPWRHRREVSRRQAFAQGEVIEEKTRQYHGLLLQVLPKPIADRLQAGERDIADLFDDATVLFADIVGFSRWSKGQAPGDVLGLLRDLFGRFDELAEQHGLEKIKTIGDAYMVAGGVPNTEPDHCRNVASFALDMVAATADFEALDGSPLLLRVGVHTGPLVGGVTGQLRFIYDLWGDTVNTASRMESHGAPGRIQVTQTVYEALPDGFLFEERGVVEVKGRGPMRTFWLVDRVEPMAG